MRAAIEGCFPDVVETASARLCWAKEGTQRGDDRDDFDVSFQQSVAIINGPMRPVRCARVRGSCVRRRCPGLLCPPRPPVLDNAHYHRGVGFRRVRSSSRRVRRQPGRGSTCAGRGPQAPPWPVRLDGQRGAGADPRVVTVIRGRLRSGASEPGEATSVLLVAPSLCRICDTCTPTVRGLITRILPISALLRPVASNARTSSSRPVSPSFAAALATPSGSCTGPTRSRAAAIFSIACWRGAGLTRPIPTFSAGWPRARRKRAPAPPARYPPRSG